MPNNIYIHLFSIALFLVSFVVIIRCRASRVYKLFFSLLAFAYVFFYEVYQVADYFTGNGIDQATVIQLKFGLGGAPFGEYVQLAALTFGILLVSILFLTVFVLVRPKKNRSGSSGQCATAYGLLFVALLSNPASIDVYNLPRGALIASRISGGSGSVEFYKFYKKPQLKQVSKERKNLVVIYAESLEQAFFNEEVFPGLVPGLKEIEKQSISFSNMHMAHGTGGTIWAISAGLCGLPLFLPGRTILKRPGGEFLGSATCLGDLLKEDDYYLTYYGGANLEFTRKGDFFRSHGFTDIYGKNELIPKLPDKEYVNFWGLYDDSLFDLTYKRFLELSEAGKKFGLFLLTIDTHTPGYASQTCEDLPYKDGENIHLNAVACSDFLISKFIKKIADSPYASQTVVVLASDHVNWNNTPAADLIHKARNGKKNIFMIIEPGKLEGKEVTTKGSALDIGTTILPFIGYSGQIGLGRDLLAEDSKISRERSYIANHLQLWRSEVLKFWGQDKIHNYLSVDIRKKVVSIDRKDYKAPVFIELTDELYTKMVHKFHTGIEEYLEKMDKGKKFLWIDDCKDIKLSGNKFSSKGTKLADDGWCLLTGEGKKYIYKTKLQANARYDISDLQEMLGNSSSKHLVATTKHKK